MPQPDSDTVADAFRYFVQIKRLQERFKDSSVYRFLCVVHSRSGAPMQLLMEDYDLLMDQPDYNALFGELWQLTTQMPAERQLEEAQNDSGDMFNEIQDPDASDGSGAGGSAQGTGAGSGATLSSGVGGGGGGDSATSSAGAGGGDTGTPQVKVETSPSGMQTPTFAVETPSRGSGSKQVRTPQKYSELQTLRRMLQFTPTKPSAQTETRPNEIGTAIAYGADALSDAVRGSFSTLDSMLLSELRRTNTLMPLVAAYEQRKASTTIQRMLQRDAAFEKIVFTPKALGAIDAALRMISMSFAHLRSVRLSQFLRDADARTDFGQFVGLLMLEAATLPNARGNVYVVTHPRIIAATRGLMMQIGRATVDADGDVTYNASSIATFAGTRPPLRMGSAYRFTPRLLDTAPQSISYI